MTKNKKIWIGILTFLPIAFLLLYFLNLIILFTGIFSSARVGEELDPSMMFGNFAVMFFLIFVAVVVSIGLMIFYIMQITNNKKFDSNQRLMWILIIVFAGLIGFIVYWYMYIWKDEDKTLNDVLKF
jgi:hypothetical protein